ncbi:kinesin-like protein KIF6 [Myzus persicae]|uniref:kinesin-like protein KIF6 n=1 Tax=Myzus persicae TaxID=13164 RepID=UPI000B939FE1|nr:kinesin-like protein KIF6 [Myzus persicae]
MTQLRDCESGKPVVMWCEVLIGDFRITQHFRDLTVLPLLRFLSGTNGTIFAYGQTGSGKSHTIYGSRKDAGIIPRSFKYLFDNKSAIKSTEEREIFSMSYFEIYNEIVYDLLPSTKSRQIKKSNVNNKNLGLNDIVRFTVNKKGDVDFKNLNIIKVKNVSEALKLLTSGNAKRQVSSTSMNNQSSRSHCICRIEYSNKTNGTKSNEIVLNLVDLAGSECISKMNNDKKTIAESRYINLSLMHLHQVINCLANPVQPIHVPYRNSAITKLLKGSLGFNCATAMITTIVLNYRSIVESTYTCKYARDVSGIKPIVKSEIRKKSVKLLVAKTVDLLGDKVGDSVHNDKHVTNCGTQTVVISSNVPGFGVIADMQFGVKSVLRVAKVDNDHGNSDNQMIKISLIM